MNLKKTYNPWDESGEYWNESALHKKNKIEKHLNSESWFGGEVTNDSDTSWLVSGSANSAEENFIWLPPNTNTDNLPEVIDNLDGDVDAVWPAGRPIKNYYTDEIVTSGAFKLRSHRNTNIDGNAKEGYRIWDFSVYFKENELPKGWKLPNKYK